MLVAVLEEDASLRKWLNVHRGLATNRAIAESLDLQFNTAAKVLTQNGLAA
jgi:alanine dehydrogenase